jgi:hypothetical protein
MSKGRTVTQDELTLLRAIADLPQELVSVLKTEIISKKFQPIGRRGPIGIWC